MEVILDKYDPLIYPIKIYVSITTDLQAVLSKFKKIDKTIIKDVWANNDGAMTYPDLSDESGMYSIVIVFRPNNHSVKTVAHEVNHAVNFFWDHLGEDPMGYEADAYLTGWITDCVYQTISKLSK